jgi:hypothetical protein
MFESYKNLGFLSINFTCHALATNLGCNPKGKVITIIITPTIKSFKKHILKIVDPILFLCNLDDLFFVYESNIGSRSRFKICFDH